MDNQVCKVDCTSMETVLSTRATLQTRYCDDFAPFEIDCRSHEQW
uniref:Uncharacterized protein n=1 Tax=Arundo donax TaxID=35708 RepID=A0A0A9Q9C6_ARUDO